MRIVYRVVLLLAFAGCPCVSDVLLAQTPTPTPTPTHRDMPMPSPTPMRMPMPSPTPAAPDLPGGEMQTAPAPFPPPGDWPRPVEDEHRNLFLLADVFEFSPKGSASTSFWDIEGWYGGDSSRLWFKSEGEKSTTGKDYDVDLQLLYGRFVRRFYDFQIGARIEARRFRGANVARPQLVVGIEGLRRYFYEIEALAFIDPKGNVSGRFTATKDFLFSQRLILQPRFETNLAIQKVERFGRGGGLNDIELGFRLRYEIRREFAPYIGVSFERSFFDTADFVRQEGGDPSQIRFVAGVRIWQ